MWMNNYLFFLFFLKILNTIPLTGNEKKKENNKQKKLS